MKVAALREKSVSTPASTRSQSSPAPGAHRVNPALHGAPAPAHGRVPIHTGEAGRPLEAGLRSSLETQFIVPLDDVRIHDSAASAGFARSLGANAVTVGSDIFFNKGRYHPGANDGHRLLAHEISHVVQQRPSGSSGTVEAAEAEAAALGQQALTPSALAPVRHHLAGPSTPLLDAASLKKNIEDELDDVFVGIDNTWDQIRKEPAADRDAVRTDGALERWIRQEVDPMELLKTYLLLNFQVEARFPAHFQGLIKATDKVGTNEAQIYSILGGVSETERQGMRDMPGVVEVLEDELSGKELHKAWNLLYGRVEREDTAVTTARLGTHLEISERFDLSESTGDSFDSFRAKMNAAAGALVSETSPAVLLADTSLWAEVADNFNKEEAWFLRMIARYGGERHFPHLTGPNIPSGSFLFPIWDAVEGAGTDEDKLIGTLQTAKTSTGITGGSRPTATAELREDPWFVPMLEDELSGKDLNTALSEVSGTRSGAVGIRDQLKRAINKKDMKTVRELLQDPELTATDRSRLAVDPVILEEMGEELGGWRLCETSLLLKYGSTPLPVNVASMLGRFQKNPPDVAALVAFLRGLAGTPGDLALLRAEPGVFFMVTNSGLSSKDRQSVLSALRADQAEYQEPGSEGEYRHHAESVSATLPVHFAGSQVRIVPRCNIDVSNITDEDGFDYDNIEDWVRDIDEVWNDKYVLENDGQRFDLVFAPYFGVGVASPNFTMIVFDVEGRSELSGDGLRLTLFMKNLAKMTVAHEFGHVFGNPDEYDLIASEYTRISGKKAPTPFPRSGETIEGLMGSQSESTEIALRHVLPAFEAVNATRDPATYPKPFTVKRK